MEIASLLAGEDWSDSPRCTHPTLAIVAQLINDGCTDTGRAALLRLVPDLIGVTGSDPRLAPALVCQCATAAQVRPPIRIRLGVRHARRRLTALERHRLRRVLCRLTDPLYRRGPARRALTTTVQYLTDRSQDPDRQLTAVLTECIHLSHHILNTHPGTPSTRPADDAETTVAAPTDPIHTN